MINRPDGLEHGLDFGGCTPIQRTLERRQRSADRRCEIGLGTDHNAGREGRGGDTVLGKENQVGIQLLDLLGEDTLHQRLSRLEADLVVKE